MALTSKLAGLAAGAVLTASAAFAQTYPERQITMVVPFAAGGPTDTVGRLIAERMSADLGQQIIVENVGGAGGTLGAGNVAEAEADGYTILLHHIGMATSATLYRNLAYNPSEAFEYIGLVTEVPMTIVARKDFEPADFASLVTYVKENADTITMANAGIGAASHLCGMLFMQAVEAPIVTVPYKGTGPAMTDLLGGHIPMAFAPIPASHANIAAGTLRGLAVTSTTRSGLLPDVPTIAEAALPGFDASLYYGLVAPAGTPRPIVEKLNAAMQAALAEADVRERIIADGAEPLPGTPEDYAADIDREETKWSKVVRVSGAKVE